MKNRVIEVEVVSLAEVPPTDYVAVDDVPLVLVVDDEPMVTDTVAAVLGISGLAVVKAYNGSEALEVALRRVPDLLLSDVMMPGMNGVELAIAVATELPGCKVLLFSGHATLKDLAEAHASGFDFPLMTKPIHPEEMLKRVFACLGWQPRADRAEKMFGERLPLSVATESVA